ncbi:MAG: HAD-superfamily hydrolase, subfamily variant 1 [Acidimicrobiaceae bacterium]|nr:HAD-superfamily hydrolase, subfamily variant 1 [Acidimicrobiaceae bacterium]
MARAAVLRRHNGGVPLALFDLDNTLADRATAFAKWAEIFVTRFALEPEATPWLLSLDGDGITPRPVLLRGAIDEFDLDTTVEELIDWYEESYIECFQRESASIDAVLALRDAGWKVAVVTNGPTEQQMAKLRQTELEEVVDAIVVSEACGVSKPDAGIFREAARRCDSELAGWMIGDSPSADIVGAARCGLRTIWMSRGRLWPELSGNLVFDVLKFGAD